VHQPELFSLVCSLLARSSVASPFFTDLILPPSPVRSQLIEILAWLGPVRYLVFRPDLNVWTRVYVASLAIDFFTDRFSTESPLLALACLLC